MPVYVVDNTNVFSSLTLKRRNQDRPLHKGWFRNDPTANWFSRAWGLRNGIAGEIQLAIVFCKAVREAVIQALRREGTPHHHHPARDAKHN